MDVERKRGIDRAWEMLYAGKLGSDVIDIQETRCSEKSMFMENLYTVHCSGESGGEFQKKRQGGVGIAVKQPSAHILPPGHSSS